MKRAVTFIATGFGLGYSPVASGTVGTIWGVLIVFLMSHFGVELTWQIAIAAVLVIVSIPICGIAENYLGKHDDGRIVADEYMTFPICMIGLMGSNPNLQLPSIIWVTGVAFLTCRFFDILKPPPARQCEKLSGGLGIVMDDVVASLMSLAVNHLIWRFVWPFIGS